MLCNKSPNLFLLSTWNFIPCDQQLPCPSIAQCLASGDRHTTPNFCEFSFLKIPHASDIFAFLCQVALGSSTSSQIAEFSSLLELSSVCLIVCHCWEVSDRCLKQLFMFHLQSGGEGSKHMHATCLYSTGFLGSYTVQYSLSREWCCPLWTESSHINSIRTVSHRHPHRPSQCK